MIDLPILKVIMKLTVEDVAQLTGLTAGTVREYARRMKLGTIEGRKKVFTKAEAKELQFGELPKPSKKPATKNPATRSLSRSKKPAKRR